MITHLWTLAGSPEPNWTGKARTVRAVPPRRHGTCALTGEVGDVVDLKHALSASFTRWDALHYRHTPDAGMGIPTRRIHDMMGQISAKSSKTPHPCATNYVASPELGDLTRAQVKPKAPRQEPPRPPRQQTPRPQQPTGQPATQIRRRHHQGSPQTNRQQRYRLPPAHATTTPSTQPQPQKQHTLTPTNQHELCPSPHHPTPHPPPHPPNDLDRQHLKRISPPHPTTHPQPRHTMHMRRMPPMPDNQDTHLHQNINRRRPHHQASRRRDTPTIQRSRTLPTMPPMAHQPTSPRQPNHPTTTQPKAPRTQPPTRWTAMRATRERHPAP